MALVSRLHTVHVIVINMWYSFGTLANAMVPVTGTEMVKG
jgi:hypothetical protein